MKSLMAAAGILHTHAITTADLAVDLRAARSLEQSLSSKTILNHGFRVIEYRIIDFIDILREFRLGSDRTRQQKQNA